MLSERGYSAVINDSIIDFVIIIGNIGGGTMCMIIALLYCQAVHMSSFNTAMLVSLGAFTGYLLFSLSMEVVSSAVVAVYVCFAEKPALFQVVIPCDSFILAVKYTVYPIHFVLSIPFFPLSSPKLLHNGRVSMIIICVFIIEPSSPLTNKPYPLL
jgi:Plasma-membrane choline transporter